jgi:hypothetical protein
MKREAPTERDITDLIASAYEGMAAPDARRLAAIEQRLLEQPRLRGRSKFVWWWLVGALLAGAASALWWAMDYDSGNEQGESVPTVMSPPVAPPVVKPSAPTDRSAGVESKPAGEQEGKKGPEIYRRER